MNLKMWHQQQNQRGRFPAYSFAFLDEGAKREIRRKTLKAVAIPGYQVPFGSRDMPIARGWGTGGLQITLSIIGSDDVLKVIDQGADDSVNAVSIRQFIQQMTGVETTVDVTKASIVQTRHRIPELPLKDGQILVFQVPIPEPLRLVEPAEQETRRMHAEADYSRMWLYLYEDIIKFHEITIGARYPLMVNERYLMDPSPIPRWDLPKLNDGEGLFLFGAGREKRIYAIPPHTTVVPLEFEDHRFRVEHFDGAVCAHCGRGNTFLDEIVCDADGNRIYTCSDTAYCEAGQLKGDTQ